MHIEKFKRVSFFSIDDPLFKQIPQGTALRVRCDKHPESFVWLRILPTNHPAPTVHFSDQEEAIRAQYYEKTCHIYIVQVPYSQRWGYPFWKRWEDIGNP